MSRRAEARGPWNGANGRRPARVRGATGALPPGWRQGRGAGSHRAYVQRHSPMRFTPQELQSYLDRGFVTIPQLLDATETARVVAAAERDQDLAAHAFDRADGEGGRVRLALWNHPGDDIYGVLARTARLVERAEDILGGEVYHYHSKLILKDPAVGGAWAWHQDYGYWYENGLLAPDLVSVFIALDPATPLVVAAVVDLARRLGIATGDVTVVEARAVTWGDSSLGCPQPGMKYLPRVVDGTLVVLGAGGRTYEYHGGSPLQLCEHAQAALLRVILNGPAKDDLSRVWIPGSVTVPHRKLTPEIVKDDFVQLARRRYFVCERVKHVVPGRGYDLGGFEEHCQLWIELLRVNRAGDECKAGFVKHACTKSRADQITSRPGVCRI